MHYNTLLHAIGNTPLVELRQINPSPHITLLAKLEFMNPSGSIKDRIVAYIVDQAEQNGLLKPGGTIVENTSGNTGAAVAMIAALRGYKAVLVMPDKVSIEKQSVLKAYGAEVVVTPTSASPHSPDHYVNVAKRLAAEIPNSFRINQYDNPDNPKAHYLSTGPEIWTQTKGAVDYFVASGSTGGTITGIGKYLKEQKPAVQVVMADPVGSIYYDYFTTGKIPNDGHCTYQVEGVGEDHLAQAMDFSIVDKMYQFDDQVAFSTAHALAKQEGILAGGSGGANVWAALQLAKELTKPATIVTILPDSGIKYLSKFYNQTWLSEHHYEI